MENEEKALLHNRFDIVISDAATGEVIGKYTGYNIILNQFWPLYLRAANQKTMRRIAYGSGTATPLGTDTDLTQPIGTKDATDIVIDTSEFASNGIVKRTSKIRLEADQHVGSTISEVGLRDLDGALVTKSLLKDQNGNAIQVLKTDTTIMDIYSTFFAVIPSSLMSGEARVMLGPLTSWMVCALGSATATNTLPTTLSFNNISRNEGALDSSGGAFSKAGTNTFDAANKKITCAIANITSSECNGIVGIRRMVALDSVEYDLPNAIITSPKIVKEVVGTGDGSNKDFKTKFDRIKNDGEAKVFVNDVEVSATIDYGFPGSADPLPGYLINTGVDGPWKSSGTSSPVELKDNIFENLLYDYGVGITHATGHKVRLMGRDGTSGEWAVVCSPGFWTEAAATVGRENYKYYCVEPVDANCTISGIRSTAMPAKKTIHLESAPESGATVAVTYNTDCIPKDAASVINSVSATVTFAEYTP